MISDRLKKQNPWISILRIFMCFAVIQYHFVTAVNTLPQKTMAVFGNLAVPCFMLVSFYFTNQVLKYGDKDKLKKRLARLYVPIFAWNIISFIVINVIVLLLGNKDGVIKFKTLLLSFVFPHCPGLPSHLWFLYAQMIILIVMFFILSVAKSDKAKQIVLVMLIIAAFILQYTGANFALFEGTLDAVKYSLGRCIECLPYAAIGTLFAWFFKESKKVFSIVAGLVGLILAVVCKYIDKGPAGFAYSGLYLFFASTSICIIVFALPDIIKGKVRGYINYVGSCTMGIYCLHGLVGWLLERLCASANIANRILKPETLIFDSFIFIIGFIVTATIRIINKRFKLRWVEYIA